LFSDKKIFACLELHTFSSLNKAFLPGYSESLNAADTAVVFFDPKVVKHKRLEPLSVEFIKDCFKNPNLQVFDNRNDLETFLRKKKNEDIILFMSSGNFSGLNLKEIAKQIADQT
jgi:UDP-N-acetylmuramate: L-alanyl-gamma-D-glutamyl-meso-diaminopimelate ligase